MNEQSTGTTRACVAAVSHQQEEEEDKKYPQQQSPNFPIGVWVMDRIVKLNCRHTSSSSS